jgi:Tropinone reductase 1
VVSLLYKGGVCELPAQTHFLHFQGMEQQSKRAKTGGRGGVPSRWSLQGCRIVVTGSTKGIGKAAAVEMLSLGAHVLVTSRTNDDVAAVVKELSEQFPDAACYGCACDVSTKDGRDLLTEKATELWAGELDCLVNNVGTNVRTTIEDSTEEGYAQMMRTNVDSCFFLCKDFLPMLRKGNSPAVVNVSSAAGCNSSGTGAVYAMTKVRWRSALFDWLTDRLAGWLAD